MAFMPRDIEPNPRVHVWPRDKSGRAIEQDLVDAAERNWARIDAYAQRHGQDSARTANLLEATLLALSRARARKSNGRLMRPIRNLDNYLYLAFIRRLNRQMAKEPKIETVGSRHDLDTFGNGRGRSLSPSIEKELLVKEVMTFLDEKPREMFSLRHYGYSWREVAGLVEITANNAQVHFNQGLKRARNRVMKPKNVKKPSGKGGATHE
jgi:DNA-directed RNA polymerase specialized sigma24 family protein